MPSNPRKPDKQDKQVKPAVRGRRRGPAPARPIFRDGETGRIHNPVRPIQGWAASADTEMILPPSEAILPRERSSGVVTGFHSALDQLLSGGKGSVLTPCVVLVPDDKPQAVRPASPLLSH